MLVEQRDGGEHRGRTGIENGGSGGDGSTEALEFIRVEKFIGNGMDRTKLIAVVAIVAIAVIALRRRAPTGSDSDSESEGVDRID